MQFHQFNRRRKELLLTLLALVTSWVTIAQVSTVEFEKQGPVQEVQVAILGSNPQFQHIFLRRRENPRQLCVADC